MKLDKAFNGKYSKFNLEFEYMEGVNPQRNNLTNIVFYTIGGKT